ncbi:porin [Pseudomonas syringae pv. tomato]|uniref:Porin n=1 Tax=Pseudomonas syringae pv. tomato TaxID=323 RepID=A0AB36KNU5_PSEUB|nr:MULTISPECIES: OprD family porin [Pseudomonas syringae group]KPB81799.1 Outer membrane porin [Pseudomonas syringae pv. maculicola]MBI6846232.1 OprD family porin [Pseudomonas syringae]MBX6512137.1 OprD family porin [Pseudomonas syringae pv. tomato]OPE58241.1 porin [Pseudomonas syringae pv. tomato]RMU97030.1 Outer membrane porin [Pseudomonas syringae pv. tomato]
MKTKKLWVPAAVVMGLSPLAYSSDFSESAFVKDSSLKILARNVYFDRDFAGDRATQSQRQEWAQGFITTFNSGYTPGVVGIGFDAIGMMGIKLDSSSDRINSGLLPATGSGVTGADKAQDEYSKAVGAVKFKIGNTVLKYGEQIVQNPVFLNTDSRLLPETTEGLTIVSKDIDGLKLEGGHLTSLRSMAQTNRASGVLQEADYAGFSYALTKQVTASLYASKVENYWTKRYAGLQYIIPIDGGQSLTFKFDGYQQKSIGDGLGGDLDNTAYSLKGTYAYKSHAFTLARQQINGKGKFSYGPDGGDTNYLAGYIQYMDATREDETSWQLRYDYDFASLGVPGLSFMGRYARGTGANASSTINDGTEWERDLQVNYVVQSGSAKGLNFRVRQATYRSDFTADVNELRVITEMPINIF